MLTEIQKKVLVFITKTLEQNRIEVQVTGGLAAIIYSAKRPLYDIDIEISKKDVAKVREVFKEFIIVDWNNELEDDDVFDLWMMTFEIEGVSVDVSQVEETKVRALDGEWVDLPQELEFKKISFEGLCIPVQKKEALIAYKKITARDTDLEDIRQISEF